MLSHPRVIDTNADIPLLFNLDGSISPYVSFLDKTTLTALFPISTFASILATIVRREYVHRKNGKLSPTYLGLAVTQLLENHFTNLVSKEFTVKMEDGLDEVSRGELDAVPFMTNFYKGGGRFAGLEKMLDEKVDIPAACSIELPKEISDTTEGRIGRYGPYLRRGG